MKLNRGISVFNVISYYLLGFSYIISLQIGIGYVSFLLRDPKYYDIKKEDVGTILSETGFIAEMFLIGLDVFLGPIFDILGRKLPVVIGVLMTGITFFLYPMPSQIYPWYQILKILNNCGVLIGLNAPFLPDYISAGSVGLASAYFGVTQTLAGLVSSSLIPKIGSVIDD